MCCCCRRHRQLERSTTSSDWRWREGGPPRPPEGEDVASVAWLLCCGRKARAATQRAWTTFASASSFLLGAGREVAAKASIFRARAERDSRANRRRRDGA